MATGSRPIPSDTYAFSHRTPPQQVTDLLKLQKTIQKISSILDLELLIDRIAQDISCFFGSVETDIYLRDDSGISMVLAGVHGCKLHEKGQSLRIGEQGIVGHVALTGKMHYAPDVDRDPYYVRCEELTRSEVGIPLESNGKLFGVLTVSHPEVDGFSAQQLQLLRVLSGHIAVAVENARRFEEKRLENHRMSKEAEEARLIQQALLPNNSLVIPGFFATGSWVPAGVVGGDWYDYIPLDNGQWGFVLADVSGKGMAAALLMSATRGTLRYLAQNFSSPAEVLTRLNRHLLRDFPGGRFVTMVYGVLDPATGKLSFANAGHLWPLVSNGSSARFVETAAGLPLGITDAEFSECSITLSEGSRVVLYSDGITEAMNNQEEEYGSARLAKRILESNMSSDEILADVRNFAAGTVMADDATVVIIGAR
jgi:phosphoserine phosphatase RsbU/P